MYNAGFRVLEIVTITLYLCLLMKGKVDMQRISLIIIVLSVAAFFCGCKSASESHMAVATQISEGDSIDLRKYRATKCELTRFKNELGDEYIHMLNQMQFFRKMEGKSSSPYQLAEEEQISVFHYTGGAFADVNSVLHKNNFEEISKKSIFIKVLSSALNKLPSFKGTVYRVGNLPGYHRVKILQPGDDPNRINPGRLAQFKIDGVINYKSFMSTSLLNFDGLAKSGWKCSEAEYTIHSKYGREVTSFSNSPQEKEILFVPGSEFKIRKVKVSTPPSNGCPHEVIQIELDEL